MKAARLGWAVGLLGIVAAGGAAMLALRAHDSRRSEPAPSSVQRDAPATRSASSNARSPAPQARNPTTPPPPDMRPQVRAAVDRTLAALPPKALDENALRSLLDRLAAEAKAQKAVTAFQVQPGLAAIDAAEGRIGPAKASLLRDQFTERMAKLSAELSGPPKPAERPDDLIPALDNATGEQRQELIRRYTKAADHLPPNERQQAMGRLNALLDKAAD